MTTREWKELIRQVKDDMDMMGIPYNKEIPILINPRLSKVMGKCWYLNCGGTRSVTKIEIARFVVDYDDKDLLRNVLCHELIHSADECLHCGHRKQWKVYAEEMSRHPMYHIKVHEDTEKFIKIKKPQYIIQCQCCGSETYFFRKTKKLTDYIQHIDDLICKKCQSRDFKVYSNKS